ncbi:hypothetical protein AB0O87_04625 [Microbacterium sp. NPDC076768]
MSVIGVVEVLMTSTQNTSNKLDQLSGKALEWEAPDYAIVQ